jgi:hypothetical protein
MSNLRDTIAKRRAERERPKTLAELRARKEKDKTNGTRPKTLAELRARKQATTVKRPKTLAEVKAEKNRTKGDFTRGGLRYHNARLHDGYWLIDVTNNDITFTLHNRHSAWFHDVQGRDRHMAEPVQVARALGTDISQLDISLALCERLDRELKLRGLPTREQLVRQHEEEARAARRKAKKHSEDDQD